MFRNDVVLPKTPAAKRHRKQATKRSRTLRSTTVRDSVDSGVELETKKTRRQLAILKEKADEEQTTTAVKVTDTKPPVTKRVEIREKTEENKENVDSGQLSGNIKQLVAEKECAKDDDGDSQQLPTTVSSAASSQVFSYCHFSSNAEHSG